MSISLFFPFCIFGSLLYYFLIKKLNIFGDLIVRYNLLLCFNIVEVGDIGWRYDGGVVTRELWKRRLRPVFESVKPGHYGGRPPVFLYRAGCTLGEDPQGSGYGSFVSCISRRVRKEKMETRLLRRLFSKFEQTRKKFPGLITSLLILPSQFVIFIYMNLHIFDILLYFDLLYQ